LLASIACDRNIVLPKLLVCVRAAKAFGGCPIGTFFNSYSGLLSSAPRRVLMRCMTRCRYGFLFDRSI